MPSCLHSSARAMKGCNVVICATGSRPALDPLGPFNVDYQGTKNLVTAAMREDKLRKYGPYLHELETQGIEYTPATFSAYGRRHPSVTQMMTQAAREAARRKGLGSHNAMLRRWYRLVSCEIWRRASRMVVACLPKEPRQTAFMLDGEMEGVTEEVVPTSSAWDDGADELESNMGD